MTESAPTARLEARFESCGDKTRLGHYLGTAPLKIAKTFPLETGLGVCVMDASPGLLAGDFYDFDWYLGENSRVFATTQGFTRVHPSREMPCRLRQNIRLEAQSYFQWFPQPLLLFQDAALRSETEIEIAPSARLLWGEITGAGRVGHGEVFEFHALQTRLRVRREGKLVFINQSALSPARLDPRSVGAWGDFTHQGQFLVFSPTADEALLEILRAVTEKHPAVWSGASRLEYGGIAVSMLGRRACDLAELMAELRRVLDGYAAFSSLPPRHSNP